MTASDVTVNAPRNNVKVIDLTPWIAPQMTEAVATALRFSAHPGWSNDMIVVARMWDHDPDDDERRQLGDDVVKMVEVTAAEAGLVVDGLLSVPMLLPLTETGNYVAMMFVRVLDGELAAVRARLRELLPRTCGLHALESGEVPPAIYTRT